MRQLRHLRFVLLAATLLVCGLATAQAQTLIQSREGIALRDQIDELRHEVQQLRDQIGSGASYAAPAPRPYASSGGNPNDVTAQLLVRVDQLEDQVRQLRGKVDELQNQLQTQGSDLGKRIDDLSFQMQNPQASGAAGQAPQAVRPTAPLAPTLSPQPGTLGTLSGGNPTARPPAAVPPRTPELAMQDGFAALARRDYVTAESMAHEVLANRTSPRAYDAQFLLAQAQFGQRQYSQAALSFDDTYNRAHRGAHAPDALLGLANSLTALNDRKSACEALARLHADFPTVRPDLREPVAAASQRAGCR